MHFAPLPRAARIRRPLSRIRPGRALRLGKDATRRKRRRQNTVLSERRLRRSRARGWVDFRNCQHYRGSGGSDGKNPANLRKIWSTRFWDCQHYRGFGASDRAPAANLRKIRNVRFGNGQHYRENGASGRARRANCCQNHNFCELLPPWATHGQLGGSHLSAMAAKVWESGDNSSAVCENHRACAGTARGSLL